LHSFETLGSTISDPQAELLATHFSQAVLILMLDGDEAGRHGSAAIARRLGDRMHIAVIPLGDSTQPDQLAALNSWGWYWHEERSLSQ
jgi:DNA primase